jgi:hypothetical protein
LFPGYSRSSLPACSRLACAIWRQAGNWRGDRRPCFLGCTSANMYGYAKCQTTTIRC